MVILTVQRDVLAGHKTKVLSNILFKYTSNLLILLFFLLLSAINRSRSWGDGLFIENKSVGLYQKQALTLASTCPLLLCLILSGGSCWPLLGQVNLTCLVMFCLISVSQLLHSVQIVITAILKQNKYLKKALSALCFILLLP